MFDRQGVRGKRSRIADVITWSGLALILLGVVLAVPNLAPFVMSRVRSSTASEPAPLPSVSAPTPAPTVTATPHFLMPAFGLRSEETPGVILTPELELPTPTPIPAGHAPTRIIIPAINLDAPVKMIGWELVESGGTTQAIWQVPAERTAGWHQGSAPLGLPGNTVLNGHNTGNGEVFRDLYLLGPGDQLTIHADETRFDYKIEERLLLPEAGEPLEVRISNARYIQPTADERVTLVTCHPYNSLRYRLLIIARPLEPDA
jgi:LPXTG-site transpeptidase (sortase) family protein